MFSDILGVLSCFQECSDTFLWVLSSSEMFVNVLKHTLFSDVLFRSLAVFWGVITAVLKGSCWFWVVIWCSEVFLGVLRRFCKFWAVLNSLKGSEAFFDLLVCSEVTLICSDQFWKFPEDSAVFSWRYWSVISLERLPRNLRCFEVFWHFLVGFQKLWEVP